MVARNASLRHPKLPYLHLTHNQDHMVAHPTGEPNQFSSCPKCSRFHNYITLPTTLSIIFLTCSMLCSCTQTHAQSVSRLLGMCDRTIICRLYQKLCARVRLWKSILVPCMKSTMSTLQCRFLCYSIMSHARLFLYYHASMSTPRNSVVSCPLRFLAKLPKPTENRHVCFDYVHRKIEILSYWSMQCTNQHECVGFLLIWTAFSSSEGCDTTEFKVYGGPPIFTKAFTVVSHSSIRSRMNAWQIQTAQTVSMWYIYTSYLHPASMQLAWGGGRAPEPASK